MGADDPAPDSAVDPDDAFRPDQLARYWALCFVAARRVVVDDELARDVVQEALLAAWCQRHRFDPTRASPSTWLLTVVHNKAVDCVRREERQQQHAARVATLRPLEISPQPHEVNESRARAAAVRAALLSLPDQERDVLVLSHFDGLTQAQIAERTRLPLGTVKSRSIRGLRRLRALLDRDGFSQPQEETAALAAHATTSSPATEHEPERPPL